MENLMSDLIDFIKESNRIEGITRNPSENEISCYEDFLLLKKLSIKDIENFVYTICGAPIRDKPGMNVRVGTYFPIFGGPAVRESLVQLILEINKSFANSPFQTHCKYEKLHPFIDGNGRSGRIIWAWMKKRIGHDPFFRPFLHEFYYESLQNFRH
jgi:hypothetical protein